MYSEVAYRQPSQLWPRYPSSAHLGTPSDASSRGHSRCGYDTLPQVQRQSSGTPTQGAHSQQGHSLNYLRNQASARAPQACVDEHMLRRKTPNGTLAAGYDGRPIEWAARPPANKHILMPISDGDGNVASKSRGRLGKDGPPDFRASPSTFSVEQTSGVSYDRYKAIRQNTEAFDRGSCIPIQVESEVKPFVKPGLDSVLYQGSPSHQFSHYSVGQYAPMVMQPMWPPCAGITSLNSPGPYGPYWPNGAFVPYRPAPVRDPRFFSCATGPARNSIWPGLPSSSGYFSAESHGTSDYTEATVPRFPTHWLPTLQGRTVSVDQSLISSTAQDPQATLPSTEGTLNVHSRTPFDLHSPAHLDEQYVLPTHAFAGASQASPFPASHGNGHPNRHGIGAQNAEFKERVLIWAHRVYLSLSSLKQQTRRPGPNVQYQNHRHAVEHILSQQPRQTFPKLSSIQTSTRLLRDQEQSYRDREWHRSMPASHEDGATHWTSAFLLPFAEKRSLEPANRPRSSNVQYMNSPDHAAPQPVPSESRHRPLTQSSMQVQADSSPAAIAVTALEMLSRLCQESGWEWTDGMLLGGCLAYVLGDYGKALRWYSKVLSCDPK